MPIHTIINTWDFIPGYTVWIRDYNNPCCLQGKNLVFKSFLCQIAALMLLKYICLLLSTMVDVYKIAIHRSLKFVCINFAHIV